MIFSCHHSPFWCCNCPLLHEGCMSPRSNIQVFSLKSYINLRHKFTLIYGWFELVNTHWSSPTLPLVTQFLVTFASRRMKKHFSVVSESNMALYANYSLYIQSTMASQLTTYICVATNSLGSGRLQLTLRVPGKKPRKCKFCLPCFINDRPKINNSWF